MNVVGWKESQSIVLRLAIGNISILILLFMLSNLTVHANSNIHKEYNVSFQSVDSTTLDGTLLVPDGQGPFPAVILIHGAGTHDREDYRAEAEIFVNSGIASFIYDKRSVGYSADGIGEYSRSYSLLADDVLAAVEALRYREKLDAEKIGLWGLSEGGWVGPLAAIRSDNVAFVITVGASGVPPAQQTSWTMENMFRQQGITSNSFINSMTKTGVRFLVTSELFAESKYNPIPVLEQLQQPILAIWGSNDRTAPPLESYQIMKDSLERGGNEQSSIRFIPNANHDIFFSTDGYVHSDQFAPGYAESMVTWIKNVIGEGEFKERVIGDVPQQNYISDARVVETSWIDSPLLQLGIMASIVVIFFSYLVIGSFHFFRKFKESSFSTSYHWLAPTLAICGLTSTLGFLAYYGYIMITNDPGPIILGSPLWWLVIQFLTFFTCINSLILAFSRGNMKTINTPLEKVRLFLLLVASILFVIWGLYWNIISLPV